MRRATGVLCPIFSVFGKNGIGNFSDETKYFIKYISEIGFKYMQILPLSKIGLGNSPYMSESGFSGNELYIAPDFLRREGLIDEATENNAVYHCSPYVVDYDFARENSKKLLKVAYGNINDKWRNLTETFSIKQKYWIDDYAFFKAVLEHFCVDNFLYLPKEIKNRDKNALANLKEELNDRIEYFKFVETLFYYNWQEVKNYANSVGVKIIGDLPFYLSASSCEVWSNREQFLVDKNYVPKKVAGVPPDYFNEKGQKWGNVLYDYDAMREDGFKYLYKKFEYQLELYDVLRIDHFRAFDSYYAIDNKAEDGTNGVWKKGIGREFLPKLIKKYGTERFILEDLGQITKSVKDLVKETKIPPMRVFQFGFDGTDNEHLPHNYKNDMVVYSGTHDNNTTLGWLYSLDGQTRVSVLDYVGYEGVYWGIGGKDNTSVKSIIRELLASSAGLVVLPMQDILGFGEDTRYNIPGKADGNWEYRITTDNLLDIDEKFFNENIRRYFR